MVRSHQCPRFLLARPGATQSAASGLRPRSQVVLTVDASNLVAAYAEKIAVTPINTGNARLPSLDQVRLQPETFNGNVF